MGRALSGTGCKDGPPADQRDDRCIGPTAKLGVAGGGASSAWKSLDPRVREPVRKPALAATAAACRPHHSKCRRPLDQRRPARAELHRPDRNDPALFPSPLPLSGLLGLPRTSTLIRQKIATRQKVPFCAPRTEPAEGAVTIGRFRCHSKSGPLLRIVTFPEWNGCSRHIRGPGGLTPWLPALAADALAAGSGGDRPAGRQRRWWRRDPGMPALPTAGHRVGTALRPAGRSNTRSPELGVHSCGDPGQWPRLRRRRPGAGESAPASADPRRAPGGWATWPFADLTGTPAL